jgi:hypothetical protein
VEGLLKRLGIGLLIAACLGAAGLFWCVETGKSLFVGRYLQARDGSHMVIDRHGSPIILDPPSYLPDLFDSLEDGDRILVLSDLILTSYPGRSGAYLCLRLGDGSPEDLPNETVSQLTQLGWLSQSLKET